ncbi:NAD(P)/FAD-dependent oxidoreductase [Gallaecimonas mangrovi]|uniref:NAD(P)/FAD-dependent oxidoreductase n=1 Tax=Gallaecimonas mangrovi TaxID=2291597 RepID=UPI000E20C548|nr:FAD-binding oxidoreductase [Gallaecimonas mangrovi]
MVSNPVLTAAYPPPYLEGQSPLHCPPLTEAISVDVAVVGAGLTGLNTALELASAGLKVAVLEAQVIGAGASGRSGGQVLVGYEQSLDGLKHINDAERQELWALSVAAVRRVRNQVATYRIPCNWQSGVVIAAVKPRQIKRLEAKARTLAALDVSLWDKNALQNNLASCRYLGALFDPLSGHLNPLAYTLGLARIAKEKGATIFEHSPVTAYQPAGDKLVLSTPQGQVAARQLVLAGNAYLGNLAPPLARRILPFTSSIAATAPLPAGLASQLIPGRFALFDLNTLLDYFRLDSHNRLIFGGRISAGPTPPKSLLLQLRKRMLRVFPQLAEHPFEHHWHGRLALSRYQFPDVGQLAANVYYAQGYSGQGMALAGQCGEAIAKAILGDKTQLALLSLLPQGYLPSPALAQWAGALGLAFARLKDWR